MEISTLPMSEELLSYYRQKIVTVEKEKVEMIESLQLCDVKHSDMHKLQWMLGEREEELFAHQRAVKDKDLQIFDVQEELLQLRTENQQLRVQEMEDRKRIQHLLSLTQPVTQETTFMRDVRPHKFTAQPEGRTRRERKASDGATLELVCPNPDLGARSGGPARQQLGPRGQAPQADGTATRVLRTVYLPSEKTDSMLLTIDALRAELEQHKQLSDERLSVVLEQRQQVMAEEKVRTERLMKRVGELEDRTITLTTHLRNNEKQYLLLKHKSSVTERLLREETEGHKAAHDDVHQEFHKHRLKAEDNQQQLAEELSRQTETHVKSFRAHAEKREKDHDEMQDLLAAERKRAAQLKNDLEEENARLLAKTAKLEAVRKLNAQRQKWETAQAKKDGVKKKESSHGGTGTRATLLYDRYVAATGVEAAIDPSLVSSMFPRQLLREPEDAEQ